jgi:hypothetical protein
MGDDTQRWWMALSTMNGFGPCAGDIWSHQKLVSGLTFQSDLYNSNSGTAM